jgi:hypothetical protein
MALIRDYSPAMVAQKSFRSAANHIDKEILDKDLAKAREALLKYGIMRVPGPSKDSKGITKTYTVSRPKTASVRDSLTSIAASRTSAGSPVDSESTLTAGKRSRASSAFSKGLSKLASKGSTEAPVKQMAPEEYTLQDWYYSKVAIDILFAGCN